MNAAVWHVAMRRTAIIAALFCTLVLALLGLNALAGRRSDPLTPARLTTLQLELNRNPKDKKLMAKVRRLDAQVRSDYFRHREFALRGFYLLLGGVALFLVSTEIARQCRPRLPQPRAQASEEILLTAALAQRGVLVSGGVLFGLLAAVAVLSRHDGAAEYAKNAARGPAQKNIVAAAPGAAPVATAATAAPAIPTLSSAPLPAAPTIPQPSPPTLSPYPIAQTTAPLPEPLPSPLKPFKVVPTFKPTAPKALPTLAPTPKPTTSPTNIKKPATGNQPHLASFVPDSWGGNWPRFRGPAGDGATSGPAPLKWDVKSGSGILWKVPVPLEGWNSPIVWGDKIFLSGATKTVREVYCFAVADGALLWRKTVPFTPNRESKLSTDTGFAPSTMATDGARVAAIFVNGDVVCFDFAGKLLWQRALGTPTNQYGHAASLAIYKNSLLVQWDGGDDPKDGKSALIALDLSSGKPLWKTPRPVANSWATPLVVKSGARDLLLTCASPFVIAYDAENGAEVWRIECLSGDVAPSPILAGDLVIVCAPYAEVIALRLGAKPEIAWKTSDCTPDIASPAASGDLVYLVSSEGYVVAVNAKDGLKVWEHDFKTSFHASPLIADGHVYLLDAKGVMHVLAGGKEFKILAKNPLGEDAGASPALVGGKIFIRGAKNLFCIGSAP